MKIRLFKLIDKVFGAFLISFFSKSPATSIGTPRSILVIRPGGIGDAVILLPVLTMFGQFLPHVRIDILAEKRNAEVFSIHNQAWTVYCYDKMPDFVTVLRKHYDIVIDTEQWYRLSALFARLTQAPARIGFASNIRGKLFTHPVPYSLERFERDSFADLFSIFGYIETEKLDVLQPQLPLSVKKSAIDLLGDYAGSDYIVIAPGTTVSQKRWPSENYVLLAASTCFERLNIVVLGGEGERTIGDLIRSRRPVLNLAGQTSLAETAAIIAGSKVLISVDSGLLHIGALFGVPTVALFGPSSVRKWGPRGGNHMAVTRKLTCSPCSKYGNTPKCKFGIDCMRSISVNEVLDAFKKTLRH